MAQETTKQLTSASEDVTARNRVNSLAKTFRRACTIVDSKRAGEKIGEIVVASSFDPVAAYQTAVIAYVSTGSKGRRVRQATSEIKRSLSNGSVAIVYGDSFYEGNNKIFSDGKLMAGYVALTTE